MGRIEKLVVLTVLFLAALVVAVNLSGNDDKPGAAETPLESARADLLGRAERAATETGNAAPTTPPLLTSAVDASSSAPAAPSAPLANGAPQSAASPAANGAIDRSGLRPSTVPDLWIYDWRAGDTWGGLAARVYGDASYEGVLRSANEGEAKPLPGTPVLIPMVERGAVAANPAARTAPSASDAPAPAAITAAPPAVTANEPAPAANGPRVHVVKPGDTLSSIAKQYYGSAARWRDLANANREVAPNPDRLSVGSKLRVP